ncbi:MAG: rhodanese-like domain-containing protein [Elusimicrobia bacterium]|nr:rhodanese-like domain-containing protein [Elusimicrobiota bacterium]
MKITLAVASVSVGAVREALGGPDTQVIDVRESPEYAYEFIEGTANVPSSLLNQAIGTLPKNKQVFVLCQAGISSVDAARTLKEAGFERVSHVEGGLEAWKRAGFPVRRGRGTIPIMRQVQIVAGGLALLGGLIPGLWWVAAVAGAGLLFAGLSGTCMMAGLLARMPWNKSSDAPRSCC